MVLLMLPKFCHNKINERENVHDLSVFHIQIEYNLILM